MVLVLGSVLIGLFLAREVHVHQAGNKVEIQTPMGAINVNSEKHSVGLPVYPGATGGNNNNRIFEINTPNHAVGMAMEKYTTTDGYEKVQDWYRKRLGPDFQFEQGHHSITDSDNAWKGKGSMNFNDADGAFVNKTNDGARVVALKNGSMKEQDRLVARRKERTSVVKRQFPEPLFRLRCRCSRRVVHGACCISGRANPVPRPVHQEDRGRTSRFNGEVKADASRILAGSPALLSVPCCQDALDWTRRAGERGARCSVISAVGPAPAFYHRGPSPQFRFSDLGLSVPNQRCSALAEGAEGCCLLGSACGTRSDGEGMERNGLFAVLTCSLMACRRLRMDCHCAQSS